MAGLLLGHTLSYLLAVPDPYHRDLVLRSHRARVPARRSARSRCCSCWPAWPPSWCGPGPGAGAPRRERYASLAGLLVGVQVTAFVGQELLERLVGRARPSASWSHDHILLIGVAVQILLALAGAAVLRWLVRTSDRLAETSPPRPRSRRARRPCSLGTLAGPACRRRPRGRGGPAACERLPPPDRLPLVRDARPCGRARDVFKEEHRMIRRITCDRSRPGRSRSRSVGVMASNAARPRGARGRGLSRWTVGFGTEPAYAGEPNSVQLLLAQRRRSPSSTSATRSTSRCPSATRPPLQLTRRAVLRGGGVRHAWRLSSVVHPDEPRASTRSTSPGRSTARTSTRPSRPARRRSTTS